MPDRNRAPTGPPELKGAAMITPLLLLVLLAGSVLFFGERMLYIDAPHNLFRIINEGRFQIEEHRYGSFISQLLPWLGTKLHLPLMGLMILYSAGFYLFYISVSLLLVFRFRNYGLAILLGLYFTLWVSASYYWPNNEVHQGIAWLLLVFGFNFHFADVKRPFMVTVLVFVASFFLAIWTHPLVLLAAIYLWFFYLMGNTKWPYSRLTSVVLSVGLLVLSMVKFYQGMKHGYDSSKIDGVRQFQVANIKAIFSSVQFHSFIQSCSSGYRFFTLLFVTGLVGLLLSKRYLLFAWTLVYAVGYLMLVCITFPDIDINRERAYMECEYMPLVIICCAPFVYYVLPRVNWKVSVALLSIVYCMRASTIFHAAVPYTNRVAIMERMNAKMAEKHLTKIIIPEPIPGIDEALIMNWGAPVESFFISKLKGENPQRTFIIMDENMMKLFYTASRDTMLSSWQKKSASQINPHYFNMDTSTVYQVVSYAELMR